MDETMDLRTRQALTKRVRELYRFPAGEGDVLMGATVVQRSVFPDYTALLFCEDGFLDENGQPYLMQAILPNDLPKTERLVVVYTEDGGRYLFPADDGMAALIGKEAPEAVRALNYAASKIIYHRKALTLDPVPRRLSKEELRELRRTYAKTYKKGRLLAGGLLLSLSWLLIFVMAFAFTFATKLGQYEMSTGIAILCAFAAGWILCSSLTVIGIVRLPLRRLGRDTVRTEGLLESAYESSGFGNARLNVQVILRSEGSWKRCAVGVPYYDAPLFSRMQRFDKVYRYSKDPVPKDPDACLLMKEN